MTFASAAVNWQNLRAAQAGLRADCANCAMVEDVPSPVGHALAGAAAGWFLTTTPLHAAGRAELWRYGLLFAALGTLPDIDLLVGIHRGPTHGIGAAIIAGCAVAAFTRRAGLGAGAAAAYATHTLLDWLSDDTSPPLGLMALWPFSREFYHSDVPIFPAVLRHSSSPAFWAQNFHALFWELLLLAPLAALAWWLTRSRGHASVSNRRFKPRARSLERH